MSYLMKLPLNSSFHPQLINYRKTKWVCSHSTYNSATIISAMEALYAYIKNTVGCRCGIVLVFKCNLQLHATTRLIYYIKRL